MNLWERIYVLSCQKCESSVLGTAFPVSNYLENKVGIVKVAQGNDLSLGKWQILKKHVAYRSSFSSLLRPHKH